jgi:cytochrome b
MQNAKKPLNINKLNLFFDAIIFVAFLVTTAPRFSGIAVHEWLSLALAAAVVAHLLLHWSWLVETIKRTFRALPRATRINSILNMALFIDFVIITFTGIAISQSALPLFGIQLSTNFAWRRLHDTASNIALVLIGLHIAVHWDWIVSAVRRYVIAPFAGNKSAQAPSTQPEAEVQS